MAVREKAEGAPTARRPQIPSAYMSVDGATRRPTAIQGDTPRDREEMARPSGWPKKTPRPLRGFAVSSMSCDITRVAGVGFDPP